MKWLARIISGLFLVSLCHAGDIGLEWDANTEEDLGGYKIYYKTESSGPPYDGVGAVEGDSPVDVGNVTEFTLRSLMNGVEYFFVATAYDTEVPSLESDYSNEVSAIPEEPSPPDTTPPAIVTGFSIINIQSVTAVIEAESGILVLPMQIVSETPDLAYIQTLIGESGTASYEFSVVIPGIYKIIARVKALNDGADSFWVKIDGQEEDIWDLNPTSTLNEFGIWREDEITKRGTGTFDNVQYDPYEVELTQGMHTITFRGRELETKLDYFYFSRVWISNN